MADNPGTPDFNAIIDDAVHPRKRQKFDLRTPDFDTRNSSFESNASQGSCFSVEQHLTQALDLEEDADMDEEWQLSDLIRQERLDDMVHIDNPVTEQSAYRGASPQTTSVISMPVAMNAQSQPFSTQGSAVYAGEIFKSQMPASSSSEESTSALDATASQPPSSESKASRDVEISMSLTSSDISMPPPAQPRRPSPLSQSEPSLPMEHSKSVDSTSDSFFFSLAGSSARQPFYPSGSAAKTDGQSSPKKPASPIRLPQMTPKHRRKTRPRNARGISGSFDLTASQPRQRQGSPLKLSSSAARPHASPKAQSLLNSDRDSQSYREEPDYQDDETLPPIMTQAPFETQDF